MARKQTKRTRPAQDAEEEQLEEVAVTTAETVPDDPAPQKFGQVELGAYYEVIPECVLFFTHTDRPTPWAKAGQVIRADHPVLAEMVDLQFAKVNQVEKPEDESRLVGITRSDVLWLLEGKKGNRVDAIATQKVGLAKPQIKTAPAID